MNDIGWCELVVLSHSDRSFDIGSKDHLCLDRKSPLSFGWIGLLELVLLCLTDSGFRHHIGCRGRFIGSNLFDIHY